MILVWGVRREGTPEQLKRARWLFEQFEQENAQIIVPAVAVAEYLGPANPVDHPAIVAAISSRFVVAPFDVRCASLAAALFDRRKSGRPKDVANSRKSVRADSLIIATAYMHGAPVIYTGDARCKKLALTVPMDARDVPDIAPTLFEKDVT